MQPLPALTAKGGQLRQGVDGAAHGGAGGGHHRDHRNAAAMEPIELLGDAPALHLPLRIERQAQQGFGW